MRPKGSSAKLEQRRRDAVALLKRGLKPAAVAKALKASLVSVGRWRGGVKTPWLRAVGQQPRFVLRPVALSSGCNRLRTTAL